MDKVSDLAVPDAAPVIAIFYLQIYVLFSVLVLLAAMAYDFVWDRKMEFMRRQRSSLPSREGRGVISAALKAIVLDIALSYPLEKCSRARRVSHLMTLWGFAAAVLSLLVASFGLLPSFSLSLSDPLFVVQALGNLIMLAGVFWYLPQRVNVQYEGNSVFRFTYADAFVVNLLFMGLLGVLAPVAALASSYSLALYFEVVYMLSIIMLFALTHWTKFPHAFYKAGLFIIDRMDSARGISSLPRVVDEGKKEVV